MCDERVEYSRNDVGSTAAPGAGDSEYCDDASSPIGRVTRIQTMREARAPILRARRRAVSADAR